MAARERRPALMKLRTAWRNNNRALAHRRMIFPRDSKSDP